MLVVEALMLRAGLRDAQDLPELVHDLAEARTLLEFARAEAVRREGHAAYDRPPDALIHREIELGIGEAVLENAAQHAALEAYTAPRQSHSVWTRAVTAQNFKPVEHAIVAPPRLQKIPASGGPVDIASIHGSSEQIALDTYAISIPVPRAALVSSDLSSELLAAAGFGISARALEADLTYAMLAANANMADGTPLFDASRGNLRTEVDAITVAVLDDAFEALRMQKDEAENFMALAPCAIIVPAAAEANARACITAMYGASPDAPRVLPEPRVSGSAYVVSDPALRASTFLVHLTGKPLRVSSGRIENWDGMVWRCYFDVAVRAVSWRGIVRVTLST